MAPSPTGFFHVGSARTALFNFLFARHHDGTFVLRIEDTDQSRNDPAYETLIHDAMRWLGLDADESPLLEGDFGPYRQSERTLIYQECAEQLFLSGGAYYAYETPEELAQMKAAQAAQKKPPRYNGAHRDLTPEQRAQFESQNRKPVLRLRVPAGETSWHDLVYGPITWKNAELDDFVVMKSDGGPTYNFACVVDDALMRITHVIRGEDGLSNTPRQLLIYQLMDFERPHFAHLPFLLGPDRKKLSKRHGAVNLLEFANEGILSDAMFNYLSLLGWNPGEGETQEIFGRDELVRRFSLEGVNKAGAIFDPDKLQWMNVQYLKSMPLDEFIEMARPFLEDVAPMDTQDAYTVRALELARERIHNISDIRDGARFFFSDEFPMDETGSAKHLTPQSSERMARLHEKLSILPEWNHDAIEGAIRGLATELSIKPAELIHPSRLLVSGRPVGPSLFELLNVLGRERVLRRLQTPIA